MSLELPPDDSWVSRGYGQGAIEPGNVPEDCVGDQGRDGHEANLRDVHRRYAQVTSADEMIAYLERVREEVRA